ncbi:MAG: SusC/RagA family TonB-linked outer membrane protein, partial [Mucilaginibacter sp.]
MRKHYLKHYVLVFAMLLVTSIAFAQTSSITGTVSDSKGETLPGVSVTIDGTSTGTATDINGAFKLNVAPGTYSVTAKYLGYTNVTQSVTVGTGAATVSFRMDSQSQSLNEVVVIGYGTQVRKDLTGSVATVNSKDFQKGVITTPEQLIAGKVAGVAVTSNGGAPGAGSTIRIRGGASLNASNDPLIIVDGIPLSNTGISGSPNALSLINPNDIESFSILKDASSTAIYGSRASNGVILITTKKGTSGAPQINFNTQYSISKVRKTQSMLSGDQIREYVNANGTDAEKALLGTENTDWQKLIFQNAATTDNNLSVSGTVAKALPYRISAGYLNQEGILKTGKLERTTLALNLSPSVFDKHLKINLNLKGAESKSRFADQGAIAGAATFDPTQPVYSGSNRYGGFFEFLSPTPTVNGLIANSPRNPLGLLEQQQNNSKVYRSIGNLQLDYKMHFLPDLHANLNVGYDVSKGNGTILIPDSAAGSYNRFKNADGILKSGVNNQYKSTQFNKTIEFFLSYNRDLKSIESRLEAVAGYAFYDYENKGYNFGDYSYDGVLKDGSTPVFPYGQGNNKLQSYYGRINYNYKEKYLLTATIRTDGSSRFSPLKKYATFPSAAFAWKMHEESFLKSVEGLSELKLKVGYGVTGQQDGLGDFGYQTFYSLSNNSAQYQLGDTFYNTYRPNGSAPDRKWEETATTNIAIDYGFLNGRITGSVEYYFKKTKDLLNEIEQPAGTNFANKFVINVGDMQNKGFEFSINADVVKTRDLTWNVNFNATFNQNKVTKLFISANPTNPGNQFGAPSRGTGSTVMINSVGQPRGSFYVLQQVYDETGKPIDGAFVDRNNDGVLNLLDRYHYKQADPKAYLGFSSSVNYKKWSAGFVARAHLGNYVYNDIAANAIKANVLNKLNFVSNVSTDILTTGFTGSGPTNDKYFL